MSRKIKITVVKRAFFPDVVQEYGHQGITPCDVMQDGQEFIVDSAITPPEGLCAWAYVDLHKYIVTVHESNTGNAVIGCCSDGYRPVVFKLEPMD